jgi:ABC-type transport system substrate-binding protein
VLEAIAFAVPWADVIQELSAMHGQEISIVVETPNQGFSLSPDAEFDPEKAKELMAEAGYPDGIPVRFLVFTAGDESLQFLAEVMFEYQSDTGFQIEEFLEMPMEEADELVGAVIADGEQVIWLRWW